MLLTVRFFLFIFHDYGKSSWIISFKSFPLKYANQCIKITTEHIQDCYIGLFLLYRLFSIRCSDAIFWVHIYFTSYYGECNLVCSIEDQNKIVSGRDYTAIWDAYIYTSVSLLKMLSTRFYDSDWISPCHPCQYVYSEERCYHVTYCIMKHHWRVLHKHLEII